jgi:tetratricopeptide (TPR) repeat protein
VDDDAKLEARLSELDEQIAELSGDSSERARLARALQARAGTLGRLGRFEETDAAFGWLETEFADDLDDDIAATVARGGFRRAWFRMKSGAVDGALTAIEHFLDTYVDDPPPGRIDLVVKAFALKARLLWKLGRVDAATDVYDSTFAAYGESGDSEVLVAVARMLAAEIVLARDAGRHDRALDITSALVTEFGDSDDSELKRHVGSALFCRALSHGELGNTVEQLATWREIWDRYAQDPSPPWETIAISARYNEAHHLMELGRAAEAAALCDSLIDQAEPGGSEDADDVIGRAIQLRLGTLKAPMSSGQALSELEDVARRCRRLSGPAVRSARNWGVWRRVWWLIDAGRVTEAIAASDDLLARIRGEADPEVLRQGALTLHSLARLFVGHERYHRPERKLFVRLFVSAAEITQRSIHQYPPAGRVARTINYQRICRRQAMRILEGLADRFAGTDDPELQRVLAAALITKAIRLTHRPAAGQLFMSTLELGSASVYAYTERMQETSDSATGRRHAAAYALMAAVAEEDEEREKDAYSRIIDEFGSDRGVGVRLFVLVARIYRRIT